MRKKRKVRRVMGWLLSFQLRDPGAGVCWAVSMWSVLGGDGGRSVDVTCEGVNTIVGESFASRGICHLQVLRNARRQVGVSRGSSGRSFTSPPHPPTRHRLSGAGECPR
jgi:hypothetical protein